MTLPNVVIAGAPKCGTTSMFNWLTDHPEVCGSVVKEPFYLMDSGHPLCRRDSNYHDQGLVGYQAYFGECSGATVVLEATTHYIYQETARQVLAHLTPVPEIVLMLRKPAARVYSSFRYTQNNKASLDKRLSFAEYVDAVLRGRASSLERHFTSKSSAYVVLNDVQYSQYVDYVATWIASFGRQKLHVFLFEQMQADPRGFMQGLSRRLGIDPAFYDHYSFVQRNETIALRDPAAYRRAKTLARVLPAGPLKQSLKRVFMWLQSDRTGAGVSPADRAALARLEAHFRPFNERLEQLLGIDLSAWKEQPQAHAAAETGIGRSARG